jgi:predicted ATP-dependent protease
MKLTVTVALVSLLATTGCMREQQNRISRMVDSLRRAGALDRTGAGGQHDPCALLTSAEAEQLLGQLRHDPYRVDGSGNPSPSGAACRYETLNGRHVIMDVTFDGAQLGMRAIMLGVQIASPVFGNDSVQLAALRGHWDELHLIPGHLMVRKGDAMVDVGFQGSRAGLAGAAQLADEALARIGTPLPYDGAAAARSAPGPLIAPRDPCTLLSRAEAEAIVGRLARAPEPGNDQTSCTFTLAARRGLGGQQVQLTVQWRDGFAALEGARYTAGLVQRQVGGMPPAAAGDSQFGKFMQQVQGAMRAQGIGTQMGAGGLTSDSAVAGPWDEASLISGLQFSAVKQDVMLSVDLRTIPYDQARALIAKAVEHL